MRDLLITLFVCSFNFLFFISNLYLPLLADQNHNGWEWHIFDVGGCRTSVWISLIWKMIGLADNPSAFSMAAIFRECECYHISYVFLIYFSSGSKLDKTCVPAFSITRICFRSTLGGRQQCKPLRRFYYPVDIYLLIETIGENSTNFVFEQMRSSKA
jgi:hypothetical protein